MIKIKDSIENRELMQALGSRNREVSSQAAETLAAFLAPIVLQVLNQAATSTMVYETTPFNEDDNPSFPLDLYYGTDIGHVTTWSQEVAGGLGTSKVTGFQELKVDTFPMNSAVSFDKKYARKNRLDVLAGALNRMSQELLLKQEGNAWAVILKSLAEALTNGQRHVIRATTAGVLQLDDFNNLLVRARRINASFAGGTPANFNSKGLTDLIFSPEAMAQVRSFAYQPMNTRAGSIGGTETSNTAVPLPDSVREEIYNAAGTMGIYGVGLTDILELGVGANYNSLFDVLAGSISYTKIDGSGGAAFNGSTEQIVCGFDRRRANLKRAVVRNSEDRGEILVRPDDQFFVRQDKTGFFAEVRQGYVNVDSRGQVGLIY